MNRRTAEQRPAVLSIAGSDSGGGAGIQADLKTFTALGVWGTTALTCLTAQQPAAVRGVMPAPAAFVRLQIDTVCEGFAVKSVKTGMLYNAAIIREVARTLAARSFDFLVVDPVMVATSGALLLRPDAVRILRERLLPLATLVTPNIPEAEALAEMRICNHDQQREAARRIAVRCGVACVVKGGHLGSGDCTDVLFSAGRFWVCRRQRLPVKNTHGTGCTFSAAAAAWLARAAALPQAVRRAQAFVGRMLRGAH